MLIENSYREMKSHGNNEDDLELLKLEAQAELELLKMRIELQKKKQNKINSTNETFLHFTSLSERRVSLAAASCSAS